MSKTEPYFLDDRVVIPKEVKEMSKEDLDREIAKLEEEARKKKEKDQKLVAAI